MHERPDPAPPGPADREAIRRLVAAGLPAAAAPRWLAETHALCAPLALGRERPPQEAAVYRELDRIEREERARSLRRVVRQGARRVPGSARSILLALAAPLPVAEASGLRSALAAEAERRPSRVLLGERAWSPRRDAAGPDPATGLTRLASLALLLEPGFDGALARLELTFVLQHGRGARLAEGVRALGDLAMGAPSPGAARDGLGVLAALIACAGGPADRVADGRRRRG